MDVKKRMDKKLKKVVLVLENLDSVEIAADNVNYLFVSDIKKDLTYHYGKFRTYETVEEFYIEIKKEADTIECRDKNYIGDGKTAFERLMQYNDVTQVQYEFEEGEPYLHFVEWVHSKGEENENQRTSVQYVAGREMLVIECKKRIEEENGELK